MRRASARNPDALVAAQEISRARAVVEQVRAASLPTLTANATFLQLDSNRLSSINGGVIQRGEKILDIVPEDLHQHTPLVIGSRDDVSFAARIIGAEAAVSAK